jgi:hypothetical protein
MKKSRRPVPRRFNPEAPRRVHNFLDSTADRIRSVEAEIGKAKAEGRDVSEWEAELEILRRNVAGQELSEPWPEWHPRTFVNEDFLREDPFKLRDALFINRYPNTSWWGIIEGLLYSIEREARRVLKENPPPFDVDALFEAIEQGAKISSTVWKTDLDYHIEKHFYACFSNEELTNTQASAIAVLRGLNAIWQLTGGHWYPSGTHRLYDPGSKHTLDSITISRIAMEMALVIVNAIRGEFLDTHEPLIERGAEQQRRLQEISGKGVKKRREQFSEAERLCTEIVGGAPAWRRTNHARAVYVKNNWPKERHCPSLRFITEHIAKK